MKTALLIMVVVAVLVVAWIVVVVWRIEWLDKIENKLADVWVRLKNVFSGPRDT